MAAIVVCTLAFTLAVPLRTYLAQRAEVAEQEELKSSLESKVAELIERRAELADPAQVEAEARRRLRFVMPGETPYIVQLPDGMTTAEERAAEERRRLAQPWYEQLWTSVTEERR